MNASKVRFILLAIGIALASLPVTSSRAQFSDFQPAKGVRLSKVVLANQPAPTPITAKFGRSSTTIQRALQPLLEQVENHVVSLESIHGRKSLGTIVSTSGLIVGKRTELTRSVKVTFNGETIPGSVIASHTEYDIALILIDPKQLSSPLLPIRFTRQAMSDSSLTSGKFVVSFSSDKESAKLGAISVRKQRFPVDQPVCTDCVNLGAVVSNFLVTKSLKSRSGIPTVPWARCDQSLPSNCSGTMRIVSGRFALRGGRQTHLKPT